MAPHDRKWSEMESEDARKRYEMARTIVFEIKTSMMHIGNQCIWLDRLVLYPLTSSTSHYLSIQISI